MATVVMVLLALGLAATAIILANRSQRDRLHAEKARLSAESLLYESSLAPLRAQRLAGRMGQRSQGLAAVEVAAKIRPSDELRDQAISILALTDFEDSGVWHRMPTNAVFLTIDPSHRLYAHVSEPYTISVHRVGETKELFRVKDRSALEPGACFIGYERYVCSMGPWAVRIWNATNGASVFEYEVRRQEERIVDRALSVEEGVLAMTDATGALKVYNLASGSVLWETRALERPGMVMFGPDSSRLAVETGTEIQIWNWREQTILARTRKESTGVGALRWRADGRTLVAGGSDGIVYVWDIERGRTGRLTGHTRELVALHLHPTEPLLVSFAWDSSLRVWDLSSGNALLQFSGMIPLGFSEDGKEFAVWNMSRGLGFLKPQTPDVYKSLGTTPGVAARFTAVDFSPDGRQLLATENSAVILWDAESGERRTFAGTERGVGAWFEDEGTVLIAKAAGLERRVFTNGTLQLLKSLPLENGLIIGSAAVDGSRKHLVAHVQRSNQGVIIDTGTGKVRTRLDGQYGFSDPAFSEDGRWVASGCWHPVFTKRMTAAVWEAATGRMITNFPTTKCSVAFSPDARWLILCAAEDYTLIETATWTVARKFPRYEAMVDFGYAGFSANSEMLALHATDRSLQLQDIKTGLEMARLWAPDKKIVKGISFSPNGRFLAAATEANVQLWNLENLNARLSTHGLNWGKPAPKRIQFAATPDRIGVVISMISAAILLTVALALLLQRHQRHALSRYEEVDSAMAASQRELLHGQKMRALGTLAAGIAHDFNNLLSVIRISNKLVARRGHNDPVIGENSSEIEQAVQQGKNVVQAMLGYSREDLDDEKPFRLADLVDDVVALLSKQFLTGITLTLDLDRSAPEIKMPRARMEQLLLNLIVNASEAMEGQGKLTLVVRAVRGPATAGVLQPEVAPVYSELIVADSGPGIPMEIQPRIFEPFFTTKTVGATRGTGLGLSMVYTIARDCGLGIGLESTAGGARFIVLFPAAKAAGRDLPIPTLPAATVNSPP